MLTRLEVHDFRVVRRLTLTPGPGLIAITGETGAGKSVLVGALEAALGQPMDASDIRAPADSALVVAQFRVSPESPVHDRLKDLLPTWAGGTLTVERRVHKSGRSSCRIQGVAVSRETLMAVGDWLVDIHGQHAHQLLLSSSAQLDVLDGSGGLVPARRAVGDAYRAWVNLRLAVRQKREEVERAQREAERREFQRAELRAAKLVRGERGELERELRVLSSAHQWKELCLQACETLLESDSAIVPQLTRLLRTLHDLGAQFPELQRALQSAQGASLELQELADVLRRVDSRLNVDPERLRQVEERVGLLVGLERKYGLDHEGLMSLLERLEAEASAGVEAREELARLEQAVEEARGHLEEVASDLSARRLKAAERLIPLIEAEFAGLGLEKARFAIRLEPQPVRDGFAGDARGKERAVFLFGASPGEELRELARVASGGELSRIMLAVKSVLGVVDPVETMVFDEIDTGVGGGLARVVGQRLRSLAQSRQVVCVTHLAPVAAQAHQHFVVEKEAGDRIAVAVREARGEERVEEIARMLGGFPITEEARRHARAMVWGDKEGADG